MFFQLALELPFALLRP